MLSQFCKDWRQYFLPFSLLATFTTMLPIAGTMGIILTFPMMWVCYLVTLCIGEISTEKSFFQAWNEKQKHSLICFFGAFFTAVFLGTFLGITSSQEISFFTNLFIFFPVAFFLSLGSLDKTRKHTFIPTIQAFFLGVTIVWISSILLYELTQSMTAIYRMTLEILIIMPLLALPAWLAAQIRERV